MSYGFCPRCASPGKDRERRPNGNDTCERGCVYPSASATNTPKKVSHPISPSVTKEDLELIDALVWAGVLSRPVARDVATCAEAGRIATYISEKGLAPAIHPPQVIIRALLAAEKERIDWDKVTAETMEAINRHDFSSRGRSHVDCAELHDVCPHKPETD